MYKLKWILLALQKWLFYLSIFLIELPGVYTGVCATKEVQHGEVPALTLFSLNSFSPQTDCGGEEPSSLETALLHLAAWWGASAPPPQSHPHLSVSPLLHLREDEEAGSWLQQAITRRLRFTGTSNSFGEQLWGGGQRRCPHQEVLQVWGGGWAPRCSVTTVARVCVPIPKQVAASTRAPTKYDQAQSPTRYIYFTEQLADLSHFCITVDQQPWVADLTTMSDTIYNFFHHPPPAKQVSLRPSPFCQKQLLSNWTHQDVVTACCATALWLHWNSKWVCCHHPVLAVQGERDFHWASWLYMSTT